MNVNEHNPFSGAPGSFGLPGDYFQRSAAAIANKIEWQDEHASYPALLKYRDATGFTVPQHYFNSSELQLECIPLEALHAIPKTNPFAVPAQYFEELEVSLLGAGMDEQLPDAQVLPDLTKKLPFTTPVHYFTEQQERIKTSVATKQEGRVIRLFFAKTWYAAAALLIAAFGIWIYTSSVKPVESSDCGTIACLDRMDLLNTKTLEKLDNEELYELVNSKQLEEHLNTSSDKNKTTPAPDSSTQSDVVDDLPDGI